MSVDALATVLFRGLFSANLADRSGAFRTLRTPWFSRGAPVRRDQRAGTLRSCVPLGIITLIMPLERQNWRLRMNPGQPIVGCAIVAALVACSPGLSAAGAEPAIAKIVGLGATPCPQFERCGKDRSGTGCPPPRPPRNGGRPTQKIERQLGRRGAPWGEPQRSHRAVPNPPLHGDHPTGASAVPRDSRRLCAARK
jgi:hypothetical protein